MQGSGLGLTMSNFKTTTKYQSNPDAPPYRQLYPGLNFQGMCKECSCIVDTKIGYSKKDKQPIQIAKEIGKQYCTNCSEYIPAQNITSILFFDCLVKFEGQRNDSYMIESQYYEDDGNGYTQLTGELVQYNYLDVYCVPYTDNQNTQMEVKNYQFD